MGTVSGPRWSGETDYTRIPYGARPASGALAEQAMVAETRATAGQGERVATRAGAPDAARGRGWWDGRWARAVRRPPSLRLESGSTDRTRGPPCPAQLPGRA